ncbi:MAG: hypothetical protein JWM98_1633 [Thermoleophilia bacterium]|nr:hypothetical protein [Thermoleophilia bacterium]
MATHPAHTVRTWTNRAGMAGRLLDAILALPVQVEGLATSQGRLPAGRTTTTVELRGRGHTGRGEDVSYSSDTQAALPGIYAALDLAGSWTMGSLSEHLETLDPLVPEDPRMSDKPGFHRWAVESAALDLALRQRGCDLAELVGEPWRPVRVSLSMGLGDPPTAEVVDRWLELDPTITFKLDTSMDWDHELVGDLAAHPGAVSTVDFKGLYHGDWISNDYPPTLYQAVAQGLPEALLEDARLDDAVRDAFDEGAFARLAWDYPITTPQDVPGLERSTAAFSDLRPGAVNIKPSRFGSLERLLGTIMLCDAEGLPCYAGGQFELGIGRTQVQSIASLCFPDAPNDCAPAMFHGATPATPDLPLGPVTVPAGQPGFGWDAPTPASPVA